MYAVIGKIIRCELAHAIESPSDFPSFILTCSVSTYMYLLQIKRE